MKWFLIPILFASLVFGCTGITKMSLQISEAEVQQVEQEKLISENVLKTWPYRSGQIKAYVKYYEDRLPADFMKAVRRLDVLAKKPSLTDEEKGESYLLRWYIRVEAGKEGIRQIAPLLEMLL